jgi:hypothetical protein
MADIKITESLDDREVVAAWARQMKALENLERRMTALAKESKRANDETAKGTFKITEEIKKAASSAVSWAAGLLSVGKAFDVITAANNEALREAQKIGREYDSIFRKMDALSGISGPEAEAVRKRVINAAKEAGTTVERAALARKALEGSGASTEEASGGLNVAILKGMAALGQGDADPSETSSAVMGMLAAMGLDKTEANATDILSRLHTMKESNFELPALPMLAKNAPGMRSIDITQQFAAFATLLETKMPPAEAANALGQIGNKLQSQKDNKSAQKGFRALGINNDDVDLIGEGESLFQALGVIEAAYNKMPEGGTRDTDLANIIGVDHLSAFKQLMHNRKLMQGYMDVQKDRSGYFNAIGIGTSGRNAAENRLDVQIAEQALANDQMDDLIVKQRDLMFREAGSPAFARWMNNTVYSVARGVGMPQSWAHGLSSPIEMPFTEVQSRLQQNLQAAPDPQMKEQTQVLKEIRDRLPAGPQRGNAAPPVLGVGKPTT